MDKTTETLSTHPACQERRCDFFCEPNGDLKPATWQWFALRGNLDSPAIREIAPENIFTLGCGNLRLSVWQLPTVC